MTPYARQVLREVAAQNGLHPLQIVGSVCTMRFVRARVEVARRLAAERGYSTPQIGRILNKDHTTIVFYLGRGKRRPSERVMTPCWRKPRIAHLNCKRCRLCFIGSWHDSKKPPKPRRYSLAPYAGADREYIWKEIMQCTSSEG
jgi:hypothetical protein